MSRIKELLELGSGDVIGNALTAIFWFYLASQIDPNNYGELHWFLSIAAMLSSVASIGNITTLTVYISKQIPIQSTLNFISLIFSAFLSVIVIIFFPSFFIIDSGILLVAYVINTLVIGDILGRKKFKDYTIFTISQKGLTLVIGIFFFYLFGYESIIFAIIISYIMHYKRLISLVKKIKIDYELLKTKKEYIFNNYISFSILSSTLGAGQIDKIIIAPLMGYTILGNFSLGMQIISILLMISNIFYKYTLSHDASESDTKKLKITLIIISIIISMTVFFFGPNLIIMFFPNYIELEKSIGVLSLIIIPATVGLMIQSKILAAEKSRIILLNSIVTFVALFASLVVLAPMFGMIGIAFSLLISQCLRVIILGISILNLNFFKK